jgi:hypothetical protein
MSTGEQNPSAGAVDPAQSADRYRAKIETELLTSDEYAHLRKQSRRTVDRERAEGRGCPYVQLGSRIFYRRRDIDRYIEAQVRGGEFRAADASAGLQPRRRGRPRKMAATEART